MLQPPPPSPSLPNLSSSLSKITPAAAEVPRDITRSCSGRSIPMGCRPSLQDATRTGRRQTSTQGPRDSEAGWVNATPDTRWAGGVQGAPQSGCWSWVSADPQPAAQPSWLLVGDAGPSLTHIPSFGWWFLFFPSPGALINIPEPADIRAGADPCNARSSYSTSFPDPCTPEPIPTARHRDTGKQAQLVWLAPQTCCQKGPSQRHGPPHSKPASGRHSSPGHPTQKGCGPQKRVPRHSSIPQLLGRRSPAQTTLWVRNTVAKEDGNSGWISVPQDNTGVALTEAT